METESGLIIPRPILTGEVIKPPKPTKPLPSLEDVQQAQKEDLYVLCTRLVESFPDDLREFVEFPGAEAFDKGAEAVLSALFCKLEQRVTTHFRKEHQALEKKTFRALSVLAAQIEKEKEAVARSVQTRKTQLVQDRDREIRKATQQIKERYAQALADLDTGKSEQLATLEAEDAQLKDAHVIDAELLTRKKAAYLSTLADLKKHFQLKY